MNSWAARSRNSRAVMSFRRNLTRAPCGGAGGCKESGPANAPLMDAKPHVHDVEHRRWSVQIPYLK